MPIIRDILVGADKRGASLGKLCEVLSINPVDLYNSEIKVPFESAWRAWEIAVEQTGDKLLGLHLGVQTNPSILGLVGHLMQSNKNLEEAFQSVCNFSSMATDMFSYSISKNKNEVIMKYEPCSPWLKISSESARQATEQAMAGTLNVFKILSGKTIRPVKTYFTYRKQKKIEEYESIFQSPLKWNANFNALVFSATDLQTPVLSYDQSLMGLFHNLIRQQLNQLKSKTGMDEQIKREILTTFCGQLPSLESMASRFNITARSFQRKLEKENLTYRAILRGIGKELASSLLKNETMKVTEIASALGYCGARAFQRAFKSWTGLSPKEYRNRMSR